MYPPLLVERLRNQGGAAVAVKEDPDLGLNRRRTPHRRCGRRTRTGPQNVVDFRLLSAAVNPVGIVFCHTHRFLRDRKLIGRLIEALVAVEGTLAAGLRRSR